MLYKYSRIVMICLVKQKLLYVVCATDIQIYTFKFFTVSVKRREVSCFMQF